MQANGLFSALRTTYSGMANQMRKLEVISENIANVERSPDKNGIVYKKKYVVDEPRKGTKKSFQHSFKLALKKNDRSHLSNSSASQKAQISPYETETKIIEVDASKSVYNPTHPMADETGYVNMPDINLVEEMVDMVTANRAYEANLSVMTAAKSMAKATLNI